MKIRRAAGLVLATSLLMGGWVAAPASAATSGTASATASAAGPEAAVVNCTLGKKRVLWKKSKKAWALVGTKTVSLPAHVAFSQSKTLHRESTFSTTVTANTSVSGSVKAGILGSLETELNVGLEALRSSTKSLSMTETFSVPGAKKARDFAFFKGVRRGTGSYVYQVCTQINQAEDSRTWSTRAKGKASGWSGEWYGAIDCSKKQKSGSIKALVRAQAC